MTKKPRLVLLDILRIVCALLIYGRHSITMYGCTYGHYLNLAIVSLTSPVMTCFFVLSGFALYYAHADEKLETVTDIKAFYSKRLITILPSYYLICVLWLLFNYLQYKNWIILAPIEIIGVQSTYNTLFGILHNGGTWFVSCMLFCYFLYPLIHILFSKCSLKFSVALILFLYLFFIYSNYIVGAFGLAGNYSNPFFRLAEFVIGIAISRIVRESREIKNNLVAFGSFAIFAACFSFVLCKMFNAQVVTTIITYLPLPCIAFVLVLSTVILFRGNRVISTLSAMSYHFYLVQMILWNLSALILSTLGLSGNIWKITVSFLACTIISFIMYRFFDKPIKSFFIKRNERKQKIYENNSNK